MTKPPIASGRLGLPDGRTLAWVEFGKPSGTPVLYFHGWPGAGVEVCHAHDEALRQEVRLIAVDRPGMGESSYQPGRTMLDWPKDVAALLDHLGQTRIRVLGCSGGGPYSLACAYALPERIERVGLICPMGPADHPRAWSELSLAHRILLRTGGGATAVRVALSPAPLFLRGGTASPLVKLGAAMVRAVKPPADRRVLADPLVLGAKVKAGQEAFKNGSAGVALDGYLLASPWGFSAADIKTVPVDLWHGERDGKVPPVMTRILESLIPGSRAVYFPEDGHSSIQIDRLSEILTTLRGAG